MKKINLTQLSLAKLATLTAALTTTLVLSGCDEKDYEGTGQHNEDWQEAVNEADFKLLYFQSENPFNPDDMNDASMRLEPLNYSHIATDGFSLTWDQYREFNGNTWPKFTIALQDENQLRLATQILGGHSNQILDLSLRPATQVLAVVGERNNTDPQNYNLPVFKILPKLALNAPYTALSPSEAGDNFNKSVFSWAPRVQWGEEIRVVVQKDQLMNAAVIEVKTNYINNVYTYSREARACNHPQYFLNYHNAKAQEKAIQAKRSNTQNVEISAYLHLMPGADQDHARLAVNGRPVDDVQPFNLNPNNGAVDECIPHFLRLDEGPTLPDTYLNLHTAVKTRGLTVNPPVPSIRDQIHSLTLAHKIGDAFDLIITNNHTARVQITSTTPRAFELLQNLATNEQIVLYREKIIELLSTVWIQDQLKEQSQVELPLEIFTNDSSYTRDNEGLFFGFQYRGVRYGFMGFRLNNTATSNLAPLCTDRVFRQQLRAARLSHVLERMDEAAALFANQTALHESIELISELTSFRNLILPAVSEPNAQGQVSRTTRTLRFDVPDGTDSRLLQALNQEYCFNQERLGTFLNQHIDPVRLGAQEGDILGIVNFHVDPTTHNITLRLQIKNTQGQSLLRNSFGREIRDSVFYRSISSLSSCGVVLLSYL